MAERRGRVGGLVPAVAADSWTSIFVASRTTRLSIAMAVLEEGKETEEGAIRSGAVAGYKPGGE